MGDKIVLKIYEVVGSGLCVASEDGQKVHDQIAVALKENRKISLSFLNVDVLTSAFLNAAVGQLYGEFSDEQIKTNLSAENMEPDDRELLKRVIDTAKGYFKDPERFKKAERSALGDSFED